MSTKSPNRPNRKPLNIFQKLIVVIQIMHSLYPMVITPFHHAAPSTKGRGMILTISAIQSMIPQSSGIRAWSNKV